jgi:hypothetical protein
MHIQLVVLKLLLLLLLGVVMVVVMVVMMVVVVVMVLLSAALPLVIRARSWSFRLTARLCGPWPLCRSAN